MTHLPQLFSPMGAAMDLFDQLNEATEWMLGNGHHYRMPQMWGNGGKAMLRFQREMERAIERLAEVGMEPMLPAAGLGPWPAIDEAEDAAAITVKVDVPGLEMKDLDVEVAGDRLTIRGMRKEEAQEKAQGLLRHERRSGSFARTITLPPYADAEKIEAKYQQGILTVTIPKIAGQESRKVAIAQG